MAHATTPHAHDPKKLMARIRAGFVLQDTSLTKWANDNGTDPSAIRQAIYGTWSGPKGRAMREKVIRAAGIREAV